MNNIPIRKYPRTRHLKGSRLQAGDEDLDQVDWASLRGVPLVVEEKIDGANSGISFDDDGSLLLQSRGHYLSGGPREQQFSLFKQWAAVHADALRSVLAQRYVLYGEWMYAKHTVFYDRLPHFFVEYDVLDKHSGEWLSTERRGELLAGLPVASVPVLFSGTLTKPEEMLQWLGPSNYSAPDPRPSFAISCTEARYSVTQAESESDVSGSMEGLYVKVEDSGVVRERLKWVRAEFQQTLLASGSHWQERPIIPNRLRDGVDIWSAELRTES